MGAQLSLKNGGKGTAVAVFRLLVKAPVERRTRFFNKDCTPSMSQSDAGDAVRKHVMLLLLVNITHPRAFPAMGV